MYKRITDLLSHFNKVNVDEINHLPSDMQKLANEIIEYNPTIPEFNPNETVLFTSIYSNSESKSHSFDISLYKDKIQRDCLWLLNRGYNIFVSSYGNTYGMVTMEELLRVLRKSYR
jgi:hypothetical protein